MNQNKHNGILSQAPAWRMFPKDDRGPEGDVEALLNVVGPVHHAPGVRQDGAFQPLRVPQGVRSGQVATETVTFTQKLRKIHFYFAQCS